ncbi:hypothetical protein Y032_0025g1264 [Ancylostoma ceylanicum]|uniref:Uncharacterized protein n=1 Tax=Ancylostoma ceylanicum TaxID=53326 RepID=A0A016UVL7_9BILA|nr:hypothetical protein Y032_0025g1264 [Ancylostoma ceylanicum]
MAITALQGEEISAFHLHAPSTAADLDDLLPHSVGRSSPHLWRRDVQAHDLTTMALSLVSPGSRVQIPPSPPVFGRQAVVRGRPMKTPRHTHMINDVKWFSE